MKKILIVSFIAILFPVMAFATDAKVNMDSIFGQSKVYKSFVTKMQEYEKAFNTDMQKQQASFMKREDKLKKNEYSSQKEYDKAYSSLEKDINAYKQKITLVSSNVEKITQEVREKIANKTVSIIESIAKKQKYNIVYNAQGIVYAANIKDISQDVLNTLNKQLPKITVSNPFVIKK